MNAVQEDRSFSPLACVTGGLKLGGSSTFLVNLSRAFAEKGLDLPVIVLSNDNDHRSDFAEISSPVIEISRDSTIYEDRLYLAASHLAELRPRAILACLGAESFETLRYVPEGTLRMGIVQSDDPLVYETIRRYSKWIDLVVGVSQTICARLAVLAEFADTPVKWIPYGIQLHDMNRTRDRGGPLRVVYVGRIIEEQKRISRIIRLVTLCLESKLSADFTFIGTGPEFPTLERVFRGVPNVHLVGGIANSQVPELLAKQDVMVLLSDYEGLPLSLLEAMALGVVPIVSNVAGGLADVVTSDCGFRVAAEQIEAAQMCLSRLASDRSLLARLSDTARLKIRENFSASKMATRYLQLTEDRVPSTPIRWTTPRIQPPIGVTPLWLYRNPARILRRLLKSGIRYSFCRPHRAFSQERSSQG